MDVQDVSEIVGVRTANDAEVRNGDSIINNFKHIIRQTD